MTRLALLAALALAPATLFASCGGGGGDDVADVDDVLACVEDAGVDAEIQPVEDPGSTGPTDYLNAGKDGEVSAAFFSDPDRVESFVATQDQATVLNGGSAERTSPTTAVSVYGDSAAVLEVKDTVTGCIGDE